MILLCREQKTLFTQCSCTVYALFTGPTILFTHLKIILLQCFQFSVSTKISSIQINPKRFFFFLLKLFIAKALAQNGPYIIRTLKTIPYTKITRKYKEYSMKFTLFRPWISLYLCVWDKFIS